MNRRSSEDPGILAGTIRVFLAEALILPTGLLTTIVLTRRLGPEGYGLLTLAATLIAWIEWTLTSVFARATVKLIGDTEDWQPVGTMVARLHLVTSGLGFLLVWFLAPQVAIILHEPDLVGILRLFALDIPVFSLAHAHRHILVGMGRFRERALASAARWMTRMVLIILLVELGLSVRGAILGSIAASVVELAVARLYVRPSMFRRSAVRTVELWGYAIPLFLSALSGRLYEKIDLVALKILGGTAAQAGVYAAAQNLALLPGIFALAFSPLLLSSLTRLLRAGQGLAARELGRDALRVVVGLLPFAALAAGSAGEIVGVILGPDFLPSAPLVALLSFAALAMLMISVTSAILTAAGKPGWTVVLTGPLVPLAVVGHLVLIPRFGSVGAAFVTTMVATTGAVAGTLAVSRIVGIVLPTITVLRSVLIGSLAYGLASRWPTPGPLLPVKLVTLGLIVLLTFLLMGEFNARETAIAQKMLRWRSLGPSPREG